MKSSRSPRRQHRGRLFRLETLEARCLLAADTVAVAAEPQDDVAPTAAETRVIYVNDATVNTSGDWTTAPGDDTNDGLTPDAPMASIEAVLQAYELGPGDVIRVDAGSYVLSETLVLTASESGVTVRGYTDTSYPERTAVLDRDNASRGTAVVELAGAEDVTIENLTLIGSAYGIYAREAAGSHRLTVRGTTLAGNITAGLWLDRGNDHVMVVDNRITGTLPSNASTQSHGMVIWGTHATVEENTVHEHSGTGLFVSGESVVANNDVYNNKLGISARGTNTTVHNNTVHGNDSGIEGDISALIVDNLVYENRNHGIIGVGIIRGNVIHSNDVGIKARGHIADNQVYHNGTGIASPGANFDMTVEGNQVYSNELGVEIASGRLERNLIYGNSQAGVRVVNGWIQVQRNTIVQHSGNALEVLGRELNLVDNILSAPNGYPIVVADEGASGLVSDYNLFHAGDSRPVALWGGHEFADLETWIYEVGLDRHSVSGDPQFLDPAGPDGILGYDPATGIDGAQDDDFRLLPDSPAIDASTPSSHFLNEPQPNGGRANLGVYGNTPLATPGLQQAIQVLGPVGLDKLTTGKETQITWRTYGLAAEQPVALINVGGPGIEQWGADRYRVDTYPWSPGVTDSVSLGDAVDPAPEAVYYTYHFSDRLQHHLPVADGQYTLRLHFQEPLFHAAIGSRLFDVILQGETVRENFDILEQAGGPQTATVVNFSAAASGGNGIDLELLSKTEWPAVLSAIEIIQTNPQGAPSPTVDVELSVDSGNTWTTIASDVPQDHYGRGSYTWTPQEPTVGNSALFQVRASSGDLPSGTSLRPFQIAPHGGFYYINDTETIGDQYTTAAGDHRNSGKSPDQPMANLAALLRSYSLDAGDTIYVDAGAYNLYSDAVIDARHSGIRIVGSDSAPAVLSREQVPGSTAILLHQAADVTIEDLTIKSGRTGISIQNSERATIRGNTILQSDTTGILLHGNSPFAMIQANQVYGRVDSSSTSVRHGIRVLSPDALVSNNTVWGFETGGGVGIEIGTSARAVISDNVVSENHVGIGGSAHFDVLIRGNAVHSNTAGIQLSREVEIIDNHVYNNHEIGIDAEGQIRGNTVHSNQWGIYGSGYISDNRVYDNIIGIVAGKRGGSPQTVGNRVYSNQIGIEVRAGSLENNLVYANDDTAVHLTGYNLRLLNNTIDHAAGDAISVSGPDTQLFNNIIVVGDGTALAISGDGAEGLQSDFNLIHLNFHPNAQAAFWDGRPRQTVADWAAASGQDANSLQADPMFAAPAGGDGVLGYDSANGLDGGSDDDFSLQPHSPAIDRGHSWYRSHTDRDGNPPRADAGVTPAGSPDYTAEPSDLSVFDGEPGGVAQGWQGANRLWPLQLPFAFPLYDALHTHIFVSSDGYLQFQPTPRPDAPQDREDRLPVAISIAPLWADLRTDGEGNDIFIHRMDNRGYITIRWQATHAADGSEVNMAVTLHRDGRIRFDYGSGNQNLAPVVGVSRGDGSNHYRAPYSGSADLADAPSLLLSLTPGVVDIGAHEFQGNSPTPAPPRAVSDAIHTARDTAVTVDVLANDLSDLELDREQLQVLAVSSDDVAITVIDGGRLHIEPRSGFTGSVMFQYQIKDTDGRTSHPATSLIHIREHLGQNPRNPADVLNSGAPTPLGALSVLNTIRRYRSAGLSEINVDQLHNAGAIDAGSGPFYDVNGDGVITPLDALSVLTAISRKQRDTAAGMAEADPLATEGTDAFWQSAVAPAIDWLSPTRREAHREQSGEVLLF